jgi:hypothetical protein
MVTTCNINIYRTVLLSLTEIIAAIKPRSVKSNGPKPESNKLFEMYHIRFPFLSEIARLAVTTFY